MCNDYAEYCRMMQALELGMPERQSKADLPQADDIRIGDLGPVMRASGNRTHANDVRLSAQRTADVVGNAVPQP